MLPSKEQEDTAALTTLGILADPIWMKKLIVGNWTGLKEGKVGVVGE
jgi:hypothetical protein